MQSQLNFYANSMHIQCKFNATAMHIQCNFNTSAMQIECQSNANSIQIQYKFNANSWQSQCKCNPNAMRQTPLRPHICHLPAPAPSGPERGRCQILLAGCWLPAGRLASLCRVAATVGGGGGTVQLLRLGSPFVFLMVYVSRC